MAELYLLPCECGQKVRVGRAQAGQSVACTCGKSLSVPTLRGLGVLEAAPAEVKPEAAGRTWSPWQGAAFSGGLAVAAVALFLCALNGWYLLNVQAFSEDKSEIVIGNATLELDDYPAERLLDEWHELQAEGLGHFHTPIWIQAQESAKVYRWRSIAFGGTGFVALLIAFGALLIGRRA
jgi:hypothetical protein